MPGYEVQIREGEKRTLKDSAVGFDTGSLVGVKQADKAEIRDGQWNRFDITAQGDHFVIVYNGKTILDGHDSKHASGKIGLQWATHAVTGKGIEFRNIKVKRLS
jgi:3-keto-disaccharide hydrolase